MHMPVNVHGAGRHMLPVHLGEIHRADADDRVIPEDAHAPLQELEPLHVRPVRRIPDALDALAVRSGKQKHEDHERRRRRARATSSGERRV